MACHTTWFFTFSYIHFLYGPFAILCQTINYKDFSFIFSVDDSFLKACKGGITGVAERVLSSMKEADGVNKVLMKQDKDCYSALHWASQNGHMNIIELLIKSLEAEQLYKVVILSNDNGETALHFASKWNQIDAMKKLLLNFKREQKTRF